MNDPRGLAPAGWHIPNNAEWTKLTNYLGGTPVAGGKMKSTGTIQDGTGIWYAPNTDATNSSGFTGLPGSNRDESGGFGNIGYVGLWWSLSKYDSSNAWVLQLDYSSSYASRFFEPKI